MIFWNCLVAYKKCTRTVYYILLSFDIPDTSLVPGTSLLKQSN